MYVPRPLFDKTKEPPVVAKTVGKFTVADEKGKPLFESSLSPQPQKKAPGSFVPPPVFEKPKTEVKKPSASPAPLFESKKTSEFDVTPEDKLKFKDFQTREIMKIKDASESIDLLDRAAVVQYGQEMNKKLAMSIDAILEMAKKTAFSDVVQLQTSKLQSLLNTNLTEEPSGGVFGLFKKKKTFAERVNELISDVDDVSQAVDKAVQHFLAMIPKLDELLEGSKSYHSELAILIAGGKDRMDVFVRRKLRKLEEQIAGTNLMSAQNARDELDIFNTFKKRVETLELSLGQNELTLAQIRMSQSTNVRIIESLQNITTNLIPLWKHSMVSAISSRNFDAVNANKDVLTKSICDIMPSTN